MKTWKQWTFSLFSGAVLLQATTCVDVGNFVANSVTAGAALFLVREVLR